MAIMRGGKDVTQQIVDHAGVLRTGPQGRKQRDMLFGVLTQALLSIDEIPVPWLDDCIDDIRKRMRELHDALETALESGAGHEAAMIEPTERDRQMVRELLSWADTRLIRPARLTAAIVAAREEGRQEALGIIADCVDLIEGWAYGPMFIKAGVQWPNGECRAPALIKAKAFLREHSSNSDKTPVSHPSTPEDEEN